MGFNALLADHSMIGFDLHDAIPPPGPVIVPAILHLSLAPSLKWIVPTYKSAESVPGPSGAPLMQRGTDIGNLIPHFAANYLLPLVWAFSGSQSHFASSSVLAERKPVAAALLVFANPNLNCCGASRPPLPFGIVLAPNTVQVALSLGDVLGGVFSMAVNSAIQYGLNMMFNSARVTNFFSSLQAPLVNYFIPEAPYLAAIVNTTVPQISRILATPYVAPVVGSWLTSLFGLGLGSPLGYTPNNDNDGPVPVIGSVGRSSGGVSDSAYELGKSLGDGITKSVSKLFDDLSSIQYPLRMGP